MNIVTRGQTAVLFSAKKNGTDEIFQESLAEMTELAVAAGINIVDKLTQNLRTIDSAHLIGSGKLEELEVVVSELEANYVFFDHKLSGVQTRNLEKYLNIHVLDRSQLILEIFAQRAQSHEGKLQVQLAQLMDQMPRMVGAWLGSLSRQGGGNASKGPGEKAIETDRRQARIKIKKIKEKLKKVQNSRDQHRSARQKNKAPSFALIGYTNSGKSSILNTLTKSNVETKDQAFMTLDPTTRKLFIPGVNNAVITDTVGFIRDLPPHLISAFKATLEESDTADVIVHVIDISNPQMNKQIQVVNELIEEFGWNKKPVIHVFNKTDLVLETQVTPTPQYEDKVFISAKTGHNIEALLLKMKEVLEGLSQSIELYFPKGKEHKIYNLSRQAIIQKKEVGTHGTICQVQISSNQISEWKQYLTKKPE